MGTTINRNYMYEDKLNALLPLMGRESTIIRDQQAIYKNFLKDVVKPYMTQTEKNPVAECEALKKSFFSMYDKICENGLTQAIVVFAMCFVVAIFSIPMLWMSVCMHERLFGNLIGKCC